MIESNYYNNFQQPYHYNNFSIQNNYQIEPIQNCNNQYENYYNNPNEQYYNSYDNNNNNEINNYNMNQNLFDIPTVNGSNRNYSNQQTNNNQTNNYQNQQLNNQIIPINQQNNVKKIGKIPNVFLSIDPSKFESSKIKKKIMFPRKMSVADLQNELIRNQRPDVPLHMKLNLKDLKRMAENLTGSILNPDPGPEACAFWIAHVANQDKTSKGPYGTIFFKEKRRAVHRINYENFRGPLKPGEILTQICKNKGICQNVYHYEIKSKRNI